MKFFYQKSKQEKSFAKREQEKIVNQAERYFKMLQWCNLLHKKRINY